MVVIVVINYKNESKTIDFVKNEISKIKYDHVIVIVNNQSSKSSDSSLVSALNAELIYDIENVNFDKSNRCFVLSQEENLGFAKGNNYGVTFANNHFDIEYILMSNNDIVLLSDDVVEKLIEKIEVLPNIGMIGPAVIGLVGEHQSPEPYYSFSLRYIWRFWLRPFLNAKQSEKYLKSGFSNYAKEGVHYKIMGSFILVNNNDFLACGMMDPNTFLYGEEIILAEKMRLLNKAVYYYPEVSVLHEHSATISKYIDKIGRQKMQFESEAYYYREYKNVSPALIKLGFISLQLFGFLKRVQMSLKK